MALYIRAFIFTVLIPGSIAGWVPYAYMQKHLPDMQLGFFHWLGLPLLLSGIVIYLWTLLSFLLKGKGTPAIWFAGFLRFIIGRDPSNLVTSGLYRYSRNPMYIGVLLTIAGQAVFFQYSALLIYALAFFAIINIVIIWIEEPHLERKFGEAYREYKKKTGRWF